MNLEDIKQILDLVKEHQLAEFEIEQDGLKLRVKKEADPQQPTLTFSTTAVAPTPTLAPPPVVPPVNDAAPVAGTAAALEEDVADVDEVELAVVKSPIVGTFYRSAEPGATSFVEIGDSVRKGQVLCIIEAMKLMNEIESEYEGEVVTAYIDNGQPVQYGERLFAIRTR
jgi:acetyl-CoA carboxylase biotin carboxyl carrier protein